MKGWEKDKDWADRFMPQIKRILGWYLIGEATDEEDAKHNTDLIVLNMEAVRIAVRVRTYFFYNNPEHPEYRGQFTIRSSRPSKIKTELAKIIEGWGDYLFYAFANEQEDKLAAWLLGDLRVFRLWFNTRLVHDAGKVPGEEIANADKSSYFRVFEIKELPQGFVVARYLSELRADG